MLFLKHWGGRVVGFLTTNSFATAEDLSCDLVTAPCACTRGGATDCTTNKFATIPRRGPETAPRRERILDRIAIEIRAPASGLSSLSILDLKRWRILRPHVPFVIESGGRNARVPKPLLHPGDIRPVLKRIGRRRRP